MKLQHRSVFLRYGLSIGKGREGGSVNTKPKCNARGKKSTKLRDPVGILFDREEM